MSTSDLDIDDLLPGGETSSAAVASAAPAAPAALSAPTVAAEVPVATSTAADNESSQGPEIEEEKEEGEKSAEALDKAAFDRFEERLRDIDEIPIVKETPEVRFGAGKNDAAGLGRMQIAIMSALFEHYCVNGSAASALSISDAGLTKNQFVRFARDARLCSATGTAAGTTDATLPARECTDMPEAYPFVHGLVCFGSSLFFARSAANAISY